MVKDCAKVDIMKEGQVSTRPAFRSPWAWFLSEIDVIY